MKKPLSTKIKLKWECISNQHDGENFLAELTVSNHGDGTLHGNDWALYFNVARKIHSDSVTGGVCIEHVNGDLYRLLPLADFGSLTPNESRVVRYASKDWVIAETDAPLGFYVVYQHGTAQAHAEALGDPEVIPFTRAEQRNRAAHDNVPVMTSALRFNENAGLSLLSAAGVGRITPTPIEAEFTGGRYQISASTLIVHGTDLASEAAFLRTALHDVSGLTLQCAANGRGITLQLGTVPVSGSGAPDEAYLLEIGSDGIAITGASAHGVANGIQTLRQLLPIAAYHRPMSTLDVPSGRVLDAPRFAYRGMMLDVARNFSSKETVLRLLDCMAIYKLNKLHFHLTDDEGWRIEIQPLPELTRFGSKRGFSTDEATNLNPCFGSGVESAHAPGTGHYSRADFVEILKFATQRHIEIISEINFPGHARAPIKAMERRYQRLMEEGKPEAAEEYLLTDFDDQSSYESVQLWRDNVVCIAKESVYRFIETVLLEVQSMYAEAGAPLTTLHTGGDEIPQGAWEGSPLCRAFMLEQGMKSTAELHDHFLARYRDMLKKYGLIFGGWEEIALSKQPGTEPARLVPNPKFVNANFQPYVWNNVWGKGQEDFAYQLANAGYKVVLSNVTNLYFDLAYAKDPHEPGYYWGGFIETRNTYDFCPLDIYTTATVDLFGNPLDPEVLRKMHRLTAEGTGNVIGIQGQLWAENARNQARVEYFIMPRIMALAERAWASDPGWTMIIEQSARDARMNEDWNEFANRLGQRELPRLDGFLGGYGYRIPLPGAKVEGGKLNANVSAPGLTMRYTVNGDEPSVTSALYAGPVPVVDGAVKIATFSSTGRKSRTVEV